MLKKILAVSGKSGLYKMITGNKKMIIAESVADGSRLPVYTHEKVMSLNDISIYTENGETPLREVFEKIFENEGGKQLSIDIKNADKKVLHEILSKALPDFDRERVHNSDIKKIIQWYNLLVGAGYTSFKEEIEENNAEGTDTATNEAETAQTADNEIKSPTKKRTSSKDKTAATK